MFKRPVVGLTDPITIECTSCGHSVEVSATIEQYKAWRNGAMIQAAMPNIPAHEREMFLSGICSTCWDLLFSTDEE